MSDRPGEHKARESAEAVRDAAESLRSNESQEAIRAFNRTDDDPRGLREDDDAPSGEEEPRSAEPADPQGEEVDEPGSDYDPEEAAEGPDDDEPTPERSDRQEQPAQQVSDAKRQILEKYGKDPDKLADALLELESRSTGPATPEDQPADDEPQRFTPRPGRDASLQDIETILKEMAETDPQVQRAIDELNETHEALKQDATRFTELKGQKEALAKEVADLNAIVGFTQKRLERIHEDDIAARESVVAELQDVRSQLVDKRAELQEANFRYSELSSANAERRHGYQVAIENIRNVGHGEYVSRQQEIQERDASRKAYDTAKRERDSALPRVMKSLGIPDDMRDAFSEDIGAAADRMSDAEFEDKVQPGRIEAWMMEVGKSVKDKYDRYAERVARGYVRRKVGDAHQPAPPKSSARAPRRREDERPISAREMDRQAGRNLRERLSGR